MEYFYATEKNTNILMVLIHRSYFLKKLSTYVFLSCFQHVRERTKSYYPSARIRCTVHHFFAGYFRHEDTFYAVITIQYFQFDQSRIMMFNAKDSYSSQYGP